MSDTGEPVDLGKRITGYCDRWSLRAGEAITLHASSHDPGPAELAVTRLHCGDPTKAGPGFSETVTDTSTWASHTGDPAGEALAAANDEPAANTGDPAGEALAAANDEPAANTGDPAGEALAAGLPPVVELDDQPLSPGSWGELPVGLTAERTVRFECAVRATRPGDDQTIVAIGDIEARLRAGAVIASRGATQAALRTEPLDPRRWYRLSLELDTTTGSLTAELTTAPSASPGRDLFEPGRHTVTIATPPGPATVDRIVLAGSSDGGRGTFDGRLGALEATIDDTTLRWDLAQQMDTPVIVETSGNDRHGELYQLPTRAITGPEWDASEQRWRDAPHHYDAVHFHRDDLYDAEWQPTATVTLPTDLASGIYCFRLTQGDQVDRVPFFVRPAPDAPTADVALLMSSATYLAYANHHMLFEGADFIGQRARLRPEHEYVRRNGDRIGLSMYEKHPDHSGVMFSSRLRPVLNLRPGADGWNFTPDTDINAWLDHTGVGHDVIGDEDVHAEGLAALAPYRVIVTCSHPEYWSTAMLDALAEWQRGGGRLMYLGGNGFYWRVAFSDGWPGAMELRRAEDGVRNWQTEDGESYHAWGGEYGGMWRRNGRPPNELVGVGFAAQGFGRATYFDVDEGAVESRAGWIFEGVSFDESEGSPRVGTSGLGGGAAGQEVDRYDTRLGSPAHAVVVASATDFGPDMVRTKEEFEGSVEYPSPDPYVRADIVFYETEGGGAVFSVGSISWFGSLARNGYDNDTAIMTTNVLRRFANPTPFEAPG